jgi:hypothetical protein
LSFFVYREFSICVLDVLHIFLHIFRQIDIFYRLLAGSACFACLRRGKRLAPRRLLKLLAPHKKGHGRDLSRRMPFARI